MDHDRSESLDIPHLVALNTIADEGTFAGARLG
jgi:hypothetical protein